ncbi:MAG: TIR domain-containing protein [Cyanobacteriota bacterium]|nr:TIR domain-containing protein [Cyanobacteriota bacterium]
MARVFISHSSRDAKAAAWIADWLRQSGFEAPFLDFDKHSGIPPGADWERTLYREIASSQALLILQSAHWDASKWCFVELAQARALGKPIFQLVGAPGTADSETAAPRAPICGDLQQLDLRVDRSAALAALARELSALALNDRGGFPWDSTRSPYPGLLAFDQEDAAIYFGRDPDIRELIEQLQVLRIHGGERLLALLGASGSGKSSLLRAGVLPRLARSGNRWILAPPFRPQYEPCDALAQALALAFADNRDWRPLDQELREAEAAEQLPGLFSRLAADLRQVHHAPEAQILISVDQAEELFVEADSETVRRFFTLLCAAMRCGDSWQVVLTLRSDFLGALQAAPGLSVPLREVSLPPLPRDRMADIITGPARVAGLEVEDAFVRAAIEDARTDDALPLLAFALREIHDREGGDGVLSLADYAALGDAAGELSPLENAVRRAADGVLAIHQPSEEEKAALRAAFVPALVHINEQNDYTRRPARWDSLPPLAWPLLDRLVDARLLTLQTRGQERWVEVAHEALLRKWPLLRQWLDEARDFLLGCHRMEKDLSEWREAAADQKAAFLLTGLKLNRAEAWLKERPRQIPPDLRHFIEASREERDRLSRQRRRSQRLLISGLSGLVLLATGAWIWAQLANRSAHEAQTRQFQSAHLSMLDIDPRQSLVHGLAAMGRLEGHLHEALPLAISLDRAAESNHLRGAFASGQDEVWALAETPGGRLISGGREGTLRVWAKDGEPEPLTLQTAHTGGVHGVVALGERDWWTAGDEGSLQHWLNGRRQGPAIDSGHGSIQALVRTADGHLLSAGTDGLLRRWDARTGQALGSPLRTGHIEVWSVAVLPNGDWVTGGREGLLQWWRQGQPRGAPLASGQGAVSALVALPNNAILSGGDDGSMRLWSQDGQLRRFLRSGHSSIVSLLRRNDGSILSGGSERLISGDRNLLRSWSFKEQLTRGSRQLGAMESLSIVELCNGDLISGGSDGRLHYWRGTRRLKSPIKTTHKRVHALTVLPTQDLVSGGDDGTVQVWRYGQPISRFPTRQNGVSSLTSLKDGTFLSGGRDGTIQRWSIHGQWPERPIQTGHGAVWAIAQLRDGDLLSGGDDGFLRRWRKGRLVGNPIKTPHTTVVSLVIRENGDWVSGGSGGDIQLWRAGRPLGDYFQVASGSVWSLLERRNGDLISANGDGSLFRYPTPVHAIKKACRQLIVAGLLAPSKDPATNEAERLCAKHINDTSSPQRQP